MNVLSQSRIGSLKNTVRQMIEGYNGLSEIIVKGDISIYVCNEELIDEIDWLQKHHIFYTRINKIEYQDAYMRVIYTQTHKDNGQSEVRNYAIPYSSILYCEGIIPYEGENINE